MNMNNFSDKMMNRFFRKVDNVVWDMFSGTVGIQLPGEGGIATLEGSGDEAEIRINLFDEMGMVVPAFAQSTPVASLVVGDLIYSDGKPHGWITAIGTKPATEDAPEKKSFTLLTPRGTVTGWKPPKVAMLGLESGVMVLRSLMTMLPDGKEGVKNMNNMLMPMMMMGGGNMDMDKIMPMMLFSQLGTDGTGNGAMGGGNMMQTMMMMQMFSGSNNNNNNGGGFFGSNK